MNPVFIIFLILIIGYSIYIIIYEKRSIQSKLIEDLLVLSKYKTIISNEENYEKHLNKIAKQTKASYILPKYKYKCSIKKYTLNKMEYFIINKNSNFQKIFYLHGGSYIENPLIFHWIFLDDLAKLTNQEIIVPIYPKAPNYDCQYAYKQVISLYKKIFNTTNIITLMGDSAGGGFALGLALLMKKQNGLNPKNIVLISPWLDLTMQNNAITQRLEKKDPLLSKKALIKAGILWANNLNPSNYLLSPINGNFTNICTITIFVGTHEIFLPDCQKLKKLLSKNDCYYFEYKKMNHDFCLQPIPEAKKVLEQINEIISKDYFKL